jgi:hypothetical protein
MVSQPQALINGFNFGALEPCVFLLINLNYSTREATLNLVKLGEFSEKIEKCLVIAAV